jgi:hypothetical protein
MGSRIISVGIANEYGLDGPGSIPENARFLSFAERPDRLWMPRSLSAVEERDADLSRLLGAEVKKGRTLTSTPQYVFMT